MTKSANCQTELPSCFLCTVPYIYIYIYHTWHGKLKFSVSRTVCIEQWIQWRHSLNNQSLDFEDLLPRICIFTTSINSCWWLCNGINGDFGVTVTLSKTCDQSHWRCDWWLVWRSHPIFNSVGMTFSHVTVHMYDLQFIYTHTDWTLLHTEHHTDKHTHTHTHAPPPHTDTHTHIRTYTDPHLCCVFGGVSPLLVGLWWGDGEVLMLNEYLVYSIILYIVGNTVCITHRHTDTYVEANTFCKDPQHVL